MSLFSLTSLSSESDLSDGFTIVIPTITPSKKPSPKALNNKPPPSPNQKSLIRRRSPSHEIVSRRDDRRSRITRARSSSRERETVTSATRSTLSSFTSSSYPSRRISRRSRSSSPTERTWSYSYDSDASSEETVEDEVDGYSRPGGSLYHVHGRTDVLPALPLEPYSAFLAAYRLVHLVGTSRPLSPDSQASSTAMQANAPSALPVHLLPTFTPTEKRARRLALLMDSEDPDIQDWSMLEFAKLSRSGRDLVRFGVFEMPARPASPVDTADEPVSDFDDASVSEVGGMNWPWSRRPKRTREEDEKRGAALEALAARLENAREAAEEREELDREQAWARETFGRWLRDGRADGVFKEAAGVLDALLRTMAREDGEEWALEPPPEPAPPPPPAPPVEVTPTPEVEFSVDEPINECDSVSLKAVAKVGTVVTDDIPVSGTETERETAVRALPEPVTTPFDAPVPTTALALGTPLVMPTSTPALEKMLDDAHPKYSPPIAIQAETPPVDPMEKQDTGEFAAAIINATRPAFKYMNSAGLPVPPTPPTYITPAAPAPKPPSPPPPTAITPSPPRGLPAPDSPPAPSHKSSASSAIPAPPKPNFLTDTASPAAPADDEDKYSSYSGFYKRDPRRAQDERPIRPHPAYDRARFGGPQPTPEQVFGTYADFYKGRSVAGSVVSRRSARSVKSTRSVRRERDGKGKEKEKERERERERSDREKGKERERAREKEKERAKEREREREREKERERERDQRERERERDKEKQREAERERERQRAKDKDRRHDTDARSHVSRKSRRDSSPTARRRDTSPRRRDPSPRRRAASPRRRDSSPHRRNSSPRRREPSPPPKRDSPLHRRDREATTMHRNRSSSRERRKPSSPRRSGKEQAKRPTTPTDDLEDIAVSSRISLETGRLTTPGPSRSASPVSGVGGRSERRPRARRRSSAGLTTPPQSVAPRSPSPSPPPKGKGKKGGKAQRLRGGAGSPSPPRRRFGPVAPPPPPSEATAEPLLAALDTDVGGEGPDEADGEAAFPPLPPLPPVQFWMPPPAQDDSDSDTEVEGDKRVPPVFLALGARRACVPYTPAFQGLDTRVVRPVSARERLALRDSASILVRLGARLEREAIGADMWSLSYVRF